jgi:GT2 family glycosyltransferase
MSTPDVTVSIVSFNTCDLLRSCLQSVAATTGVSCEVFVVDNGSSDGSTDMVAREFPAVQLIASPENRGFAAANNAAIERAHGRYVLLLNPDTIVFPGTIAAMAGFLDGHQEAGICGPKILFPDRTFQSCGYNFPTPLTEVRMSKNVGKAIRAIVGDEPAPPSGSAPYQCDWVDGACLMVRGRHRRDPPSTSSKLLYTRNSIGATTPGGRAGRFTRSPRSKCSTIAARAPSR